LDRLGFFHALNDFTRHRADIGTAVTANFAFIAHAAQRHADKIAVRRFGNRLPQRCFTNTRRADETQDRAFDLSFRALLHGQVFKNAFLDLLKAVMIGDREFLRLRLDIAFSPGFLAPGHARIQSR
jgi:hypothetical protein